MAAVAAARHGATVLLLCASWPACFTEGGRQVGGMSSGGLGQTDLGCTDAVGGLALEFYTRNRRHYDKAVITGQPDIVSTSCRLPSPKCNVTWNLEPHVARANFDAMLAEAGVSVLYEAQVASVTRVTNRLTALKLTSGDTVQGDAFIEASYEGDLLGTSAALDTVTQGCCARHILCLFLTFSRHGFDPLLRSRCPREHIFGPRGEQRARRESRWRARWQYGPRVQARDQSVRGRRLAPSARQRRGRCGASWLRRQARAGTYNFLTSRGMLWHGLPVSPPLVSRGRHTTSAYA